MARYGCFAVSGSTVPMSGGRRSAPLPMRWYVVDYADCGRVVALHRSEHEAKLDVFRSNAADRKWDKEHE